MMEEIGKQLGVSELSGWYMVKVSDINVLGGGGMINNSYSGSLMRALQQIYPHYPWDPKYVSIYLHLYVYVWFPYTVSIYSLCCTILQGYSGVEVNLKCS